MNTASRQKNSIVTRKKKHLAVCLDERNDIEGSNTRFDEVSFVHNPLPEISTQDINLSTVFLGKNINMPFFISSMTGGSEEGSRINTNLAKAANELGIPLGLGSLRVLLYHPQLKEQFSLREIAPDIPIFGNFSAVQLKELGPAAVTETCSSLELDAVAIHLNTGQELYQADGDRDFSGLLKAISTLTKQITVIVKETGFGIPPAVALKLIDAGVSYIDVAGAGGTNWVKVEALRAEPDDEYFSDGLFNDWGIPTALNLAALAAKSIREKCKGKILASGGLRTPMDFAKSIAMGAELSGTALPVIRAEHFGGVELIVSFWQDICAGVKKIMLLTGTPTIDELQNVPLILSSSLKDSAGQLANGADWRNEIA